MNRRILLYLILFTAVTVRVIGIGFGLPFTYHDDEPIIVNYALSYGSGDLSPHTFNVPPFLSYLLFFEYSIVYLLGLLFGAFKNTSDFAYLFLNNPTIFYIIGRVTLGVIPGAVSVFFIYSLGKKISGRYTGLIAALFLALNFLHARDSHYIYFDIPLTMVLLMFFIAVIKVVRSNKRRYYIQAGILTGLATAIKYTGPLLGAFLLAAFIHNIIVFKEQRRSCLAGAGLFVMISVLTFFVLNPFAFLRYENFISSLTHMPLGHQDPMFHIRVSLLGSMGLPMFLCGILGVAVGFARRNKYIMLLSVFIISYYMVIAAKSQAAERYIIPILPLLILTSAYLIHTAVSFLRRPIVKNAALVAALSIVIIPSAHRLFLADKLFLREDTRTQAYRWIKDNIPSGSVIAVDALGSWFPRLEKEKSQIEKAYAGFRDITFDEAERSLGIKMRLMLSNPAYPKTAYMMYYMRESRLRGFHSVYPDIFFDFDELKNKGTEYVILSSVLCKEEYSDFISKLKANSILIKSFSPYRKGIARLKPQEETAQPAAAFSIRELIDRRAFGPYLEVYRIRYK